jgi:hypothetical protein
VGTLGSPFLASVSTSGRVAPLGAGWALDWWVGADDRWHVPGDERAVRQSLIGSSPVVETAMRIPSGDAVQRVWAVPGDGGPVVVVEIENASPVPVALALAVVPAGGDGGPARITVDGASVEIGGRVALVAAKAPNRVAGAAGGEAPLGAVVTSGEAGEPPLAPVQSDGQAAAALVYPLPHTATLRVLIPLGEAALPAGSVADGDAVARGWAAQTEQAARLELPDDRLASALAAARRQLLLWAQASGDLSVGAAASVAGALARAGLGDEALAVLHELAYRPGANRLLVGKAKDPVAQEAWTDAAAATRDAVTPEAFLDRLGGARLGRPAALAAPIGGIRSVARWLDRASATWGWAPPGADGQLAAADPAATARFCDLVRALAVQESAEGLVLLPEVPTSWMGQGIEAHDLPTRWGVLSFAVRWHGARPALLWDLAAAGGDGPVITIPGLDPAWSSREPKGDALLAAPTVEGAPLAEPGGSFS